MKVCCMFFLALFVMSSRAQTIQETGNFIADELKNYCRAYVVIEEISDMSWIKDQVGRLGKTEAWSFDGTFLHLNFTNSFGIAPEYVISGELRADLKDLEIKDGYHNYNDRTHFECARKGCWSGRVKVDVLRGVNRRIDPSRARQLTFSGTDLFASCKDQSYKSLIKAGEFLRKSFPKQKRLF